MWSWVDKLPIVPLAIIAAILAVAPVAGTPHLVEKTGMLFQGALVKPIDIFDLFMHGTPLLLLVVRIARLVVKKLSS